MESNTKILLLRDTIQNAEKEAIELIRKLSTEKNTPFTVFSDSKDNDFKDFDQHSNMTMPDPKSTLGTFVRMSWFTIPCSGYALENGAVFGMSDHDSPWYDNKRYYLDWLDNPNYVIQCGTCTNEFPPSLLAKFVIDRK